MQADLLNILEDDLTRCQAQLEKVKKRASSIAVELGELTHLEKRLRHAIVDLAPELPGIKSEPASIRDIPEAALRTSTYSS